MAVDDVGAPRSRRTEGLIEYLRESTFPIFARLEAVDYSKEYDQIDLIVEPQVPQDCVVPIRNEEPIRLIVWPDDLLAPGVYALRDDFPLDMVHTNYLAGTHGRFLCVWEENWADLQRGLTPQALVERIRDWFARTANGEIHQLGQPLEPMVVPSAHTLVLPAGEPEKTYHVQDIIDNNGELTVVLGGIQADGELLPPFALLQVAVDPQVQGALRARPTTLAELSHALAPMGEDILQTLGEWILEPSQMGSKNVMVLLLVSIGMKREMDGAIEGSEVWAFTLSLKLHDLGEYLGHTSRSPDGTLGRILGGSEATDLDSVKLDGWRIVQKLDRRAARHYSGNSADNDAKLVGIGAGAIGSNVMLHAARAGIGTWSVIDDDVLLPHNTVRQIQFDGMIGRTKAETTHSMLDALFDESGSSHVVANVLMPGQQAEAVQDTFIGSDLVVDFSASPAVLGFLSDESSVKRTASVFLSPNGGDMVMLAEDDSRKLQIDEIEAQYFLSAANEPSLAGHLDSARVDMLRYANACQDLTQPLPPWQVQTLSAVAAGRLTPLLAENQASARVWRLAPETGALIPVELVLSEVQRIELNGSSVSVSDAVLETIRQYRHGHLPNETGGVLLGSFDLARSIVHILAALPAPPDSAQSPTYFIRGAKDLKPQVDAFQGGSAGMVNYVGEWHSHTNSVPPRPSSDDETVFAHLKEHLGSTGAPYVMLICGEYESWLRLGWQGRETGEGVLGYG